MSKKQPAPPPAPDYAAANREAVQADIDTLPLRRLIEAQARLGVGQFEGLGDADVASQLFRRQIEEAPDAARALLGLQKELGVDFVNESRRQAEAFDPTGFRLREEFGDRLRRGSGTEDLFARLNAPDYERVGNAPSLIADSGQSADMRRRLEQQVGDELALGNGLPPELQRLVEQAARARGVAVGDPLGNANVLRESLAVQRAGLDLGNQRRQNALGLLASGQGVADRTNTINQGNFANSLQAIAQRNQATQNQFAGQQQIAGQRAGARQQDSANIQSFLGLTPVAAQAGLNQNAQGGAVPFQQMGYNGANINPNAGQMGTNFAQGVFGTQAGIYGQQLQNSANPLAAIAGGFAGSLFGGLGTNLASKWIRPPTG